MSDKSTESTSFNGIFVDIQTNDDGNLEFSAGYDFDDEVNPEYIEYMKDVLAGLYAAVSGQLENIVMAGRMTRESPEFEQLLANLPGNKDDDFEYEGNVFKFPSSSTKH